MAIVVINENSPQARSLLDYLRTLPFVEEKKMSFEEAAAECNAIPLDDFIVQLRKHVNEQYDKLENA
jgi:hypothetical protein